MEQVEINKMHVQFEKENNIPEEEKRRRANDAKEKAIREANKSNTDTIKINPTKNSPLEKIKIDDPN